MGPASVVLAVGVNSEQPRPLHFNAFIWPNGYHESAWRVVKDDVRGVLGLPYYAEIARIAERGLMDSVFLLLSGGSRECAGRLLLLSRERAGADLLLKTSAMTGRMSALRSGC